MTTDTTSTLATALAQAANTAGLAPSVHNTQPWRWVLRPDQLDLRAEPERHLPGTDPDRRLLTLSCGAALHHARAALAAEGWPPRVDRFPDPADPNLLAAVTSTERGAAAAESMRLVQCMRVRHTDRRPVSDQPVPASAVAALTAAARAEGTRLQVLDADQVLELATTASRAAEAEADDPQVVEELRYWTGRGVAGGVGITEEALPQRPAETTVPGRDFGRPGTLPVGPGHDRCAAYAVLHGDEDEPDNWLRAGEALSSLWLTATELGVSVVPLSGVVEVVSTREALRRSLAGLGHPYLVLRLGIADPAHAGPPHTPRLPAAQLIDTSEARGG
nr:nitroreductase family protein [Micromonospora sp. DSM 115978]